MSVENHFLPNVCTFVANNSTNDNDNDTDDPPIRAHGVPVTTTMERKQWKRCHLLQMVVDLYNEIGVAVSHIIADDDSYDQSADGT
jgi:hypothetical protein